MAPLKAAAVEACFSAKTLGEIARITMFRPCRRAVPQFRPIAIQTRRGLCLTTLRSVNVDRREKTTPSPCRRRIHTLLGYVLCDRHMLRVICLSLWSWVHLVKQGPETFRVAIVWAATQLPFRLSTELSPPNPATYPIQSLCPNYSRQKCKSKYKTACSPETLIDVSGGAENHLAVPFRPD